MTNVLITVLMTLAIIALRASQQASAQDGVQRVPSGSEQNAAAADCEKRGQPKIGMTAPQAMDTCWGKPVRTETRVTHDSLEERLIYANGRVLKFRNGALTSILEKQ
jgi:hypothetical protein